MPVWSDRRDTVPFRDAAPHVRGEPLVAASEPWASTRLTAGFSAAGVDGTR